MMGAEAAEIATLKVEIKSLRSQVNNLQARQASPFPAWPIAGFELQDAYYDGMPQDSATAWMLKQNSDFTWKRNTANAIVEIYPWIFHKGYSAPKDAILAVNVNGRWHGLTTGVWTALAELTANLSSGSSASARFLDPEGNWHGHSITVYEATGHANFETVSSGRTIQCKWCARHPISGGVLVDPRWFMDVDICDF